MCQKRIEGSNPSVSAKSTGMLTRLRSIGHMRHQLLRFLLAIVSAQMLVVSVAGARMAVNDDFHVAQDHQLAQEHHHHDAFSIHFDHDDYSGSHVHAADSFQPAALFADDALALRPLGSNQRFRAGSSPPPDIFLDGLLRPPQTLL